MTDPRDALLRLLAGELQRLLAGDRHEWQGRADRLREAVERLDGAARVESTAHASLAAEAREIARDLPGALRRRGLVIVPVRPTETMLDAAFYPVTGENAEGTWEAMIGAAPNLLEEENQEP